MAGTSRPLRFLSGRRPRLKTPDSIHHAIDLFAAKTSAKNTCISPLGLIEKGGMLTFEVAASDVPIRFLSLFRWVFLVLASGLGVYVLINTGRAGGLIRVPGVIFCMISIGIGWLGAFFIAPRLIAVFKRINRGIGSAGNKLPIFDLSENLLLLPDTREAVPFQQLAGLGYSEGHNRWNQLWAYTHEGVALFLLNYPRSRQSITEKQGEHLAVLTGISWLGALPATSASAGSRACDFDR